MNDLPIGIPAEYQGAASLIIGLLSSLLVQPLTAISKKIFKTKGVTTVWVSFVLSIIISFAFTLPGFLAGSQSILQAVIAAAISFIRANGDYILRKAMAAGSQPIWTNSAEAIQVSPAVANQEKETNRGGSDELGKFTPLLGIENKVLATIIDICTVLGVEMSYTNLIKIGIKVGPMVIDQLDDGQLDVHRRAQVVAAVMDIKEKKL